MPSEDGLFKRHSSFQNHHIGGAAPRRFASRFVQPSLHRRAAQFPQRIRGNPTRGWRTQFMNLLGNLDRRAV
jgi:hypothetical protein